MTKLLNSISAVSCLLISSIFAQEDIGKRLQAKTVEIAAELAKGPKLEFPREEEDQNPPEIVQAAGEDFASAWKLWRAVSKIDQKPDVETSLEKSPKPESINAAEDWESFNELLIRTIEADPSPDPGEYARFDYHNLDWCGDGWLSFTSRCQSGRALALLRKGEAREALRLLARSDSPALEGLLRSFGIDPDEFAMGKWLNQACLSDEICSTAGNKAALMMLRWAELHWADELGRLKEQRAKNIYRRDDSPFFSGLNLTLLLRPDNGVTDETKTRISRFIESKGVELYPVSDWILNAPHGTEKWIVALAKSGLTDNLNEIRERSSHVLTVAGIAHPAPELRLPPKFRILVNGKPWPGDLEKEGKRVELPSLSFDCERSSFGGSLDKAGDGIFTTDPDNFMRHPDLRNVEIANWVSSSGETAASPGSPWLRTQIPLPTRFGEVIDINIETVRVAIDPQLPEEHKSPARLIEIEFEPVHPGHNPSGSCRYHLNDEPMLVLPHVSPGDYWLRVRHPGTSLMPWTKITVSKKQKVFRPPLTSGTTLVIPIEWPGGKMDLEQIPEDMARPLAWYGARGNFAFLELRKNGEKFSDFGPVPKGVAEKHPSSAIFANLAPGDYEVVLPEIKGEAQNGKSLVAVGQSPIKVSIKPEDPVYLFSDPLKISITSSSPGSDHK